MTRPSGTLGRRVRRGLAAVALAVCVGPRAALAAPVQPHVQVPVLHGLNVTAVDLRVPSGAWLPLEWYDLDQKEREPGPYKVRFRVLTPAMATGGAALQVPVCAGRKAVTVDGVAVAAPAGPVVVPVGAGWHEVVIDVDVSRYERRVACGEPPRIGQASLTMEGLGVMTFVSPHARNGGGRAVVYVPLGQDLHRPAPLLVGLHPWSGSIWTYAAYAELLAWARARNVVLLMPSGLGNSLYTADAEDEVLRAIDALAGAIAIDPRAVSIWGASMGGAGATTIGLHHPDRFATVTSFFGDSKYDVSTYVRSILPDEAAAHLVNAADVVENARHLPVWLIHGEDDRVSPIRQSEILAAALGRNGFTVRFDRVPGMGHQGALVARFVAEVVRLAATARVPDPVARVTYRSVRSSDTGAYGVRITRARATGDAFVDVERLDDGVHVHQAVGLAALVLARGALGAPSDHPPPIVVEGAAAGVQASWAGPP